MGVTSVNQQTAVQAAIATASRKTGIDFNYLMGQATVESGLRPDIRARTSSATGLYQFIDQSWLGVVKQHGAEHGIGWAADAIRQNSNGRFTVSDPGLRSAILELRKDPQIASLMAAEHAADNKEALESSLGREMSGGDLYMAHFLGLGGARKFLGAMDASPDRVAAGLFPAAARANRSIFYASNGQPRTLAQVYDKMTGKLESAVAGASGVSGAVGAPQSDQPDWSAMLADGGEVVVGNGAARGDTQWIHTTLANLQTLKEPVTPMRPTPQTARLAYMFLANLGS